MFQDKKILELITKPITQSVKFTTITSGRFWVIDSIYFRDNGYCIVAINGTAIYKHTSGRAYVDAIAGDIITVEFPDVRKVRKLEFWQNHNKCTAEWSDFKDFYYSLHDLEVTAYPFDPFNCNINVNDINRIYINNPNMNVVHLSSIHNGTQQFVGDGSAIRYLFGTQNIVHRVNLDLSPVAFNIESLHGYMKQFIESTYSGKYIWIRSNINVTGNLNAIHDDLVEANEFGTLYRFQICSTGMHGDAALFIDWLLGYSFASNQNYLHSNEFTNIVGLLDACFENRLNFKYPKANTLSVHGNADTVPAEQTEELGDTGGYSGDVNNLTEEQVSNLSNGLDYDGNGTNTAWNTSQKVFWLENAEVSAEDNTRRYPINYTY